MDVNFATSGNPLDLGMLDADDLQNFFPWDLHGLMEIGEAMSQNGAEDMATQSWAGTF